MDVHFDAAIVLRTAFLHAAAHHVGYGHAHNADCVQRFLQRVEFACPRHDDNFGDPCAGFGRDKGFFLCRFDGNRGRGGDFLCAAFRCQQEGGTAEVIGIRQPVFGGIETADLSRAEECSHLCEVLADEHIDIFINNAGFGVCGSILETDEAREEEMIQVNVAAMARLFRAVVRKMNAQGGGTILNVASSAGLLPGGPYMAGYYASKAYVVSMTRSVAEELREMHSPVYVCALCPGPVDTEFNDRAGVVFALHGITPELCVEEALLGMMHRKTIIVPSAFMRLCTSAQRLVPIPLLMPIVARQQKKKLG